MEKAQDRDELFRELGLLKQLLKTEIEALRSEVFTQFKAMDKALAKTELFPTEIDKAFQQLKELHEQRMNHMDDMVGEKSSHVLARFAERDKQARFLADAQKEAREKNEARLKEQLDSLANQISTVSSVINSQIDELKSRLHVLEGRMQ